MTCFRGVSAVTVIATILVVLVPLVPFNFIYLSNLNGTWHGSVVRFFPFIISALLVLCWLLEKKKEPASTSHCWLYFAVYMDLFCLVLGGLTGDFSMQALQKALYYGMTGQALWLVISTCCRNRSTILYFTGLTIAVASAVSVYGVAEMMYGVNWLRASLFTADNPLMLKFSGVTWWRSMSTVGNPNALGGYLVLCGPLIIWAIQPSLRHAKLRYLAWVPLFFFLASLYFTYSRGAWLGFSVGVCYFFWQSRRTTSIVCIAILFLALIFGKEGRTIGDVYKSTTAAPQSDHRLVSYYYSTMIWTTSPLLGHGVGSYWQHAKPMGSENDTPDNMYLLTLAEQGLAGLVIRLLFMILSVQSLLLLYPLLNRKIEHYKQDKYVLLNWADWLDHIKHDEFVHMQLTRAFVASLLGFMINMLTWDALYFPVTRIQFWFITGLAAAMYVSIYRPVVGREGG